MRNQLHKQSPTVEKTHNPYAAEHPKEKRRPRSLTQFLLDSDIGPVVFVGKCTQYFGWGAVVGFFLGAACIYGYAFVKPLPYAKAEVVQIPMPILTPQAPPVLLHGFVTDANNKPFTESFFVAVVAKQHGPEENPQGSYTMEVPPSSCYDLVFWTLEGLVNRRENLCPVKDGAGYRLDLRMPLEARAAVQNSKSGSLAARKERSASDFAGQ